MTFEEWWKSTGHPKHGRIFRDMYLSARKAWQAATERIVGIYLQHHPCNCSSLTHSMKPCLSCKVAQQIREDA